MAVQGVNAVERLLGTSVPCAYAVKAGPWIFLTGHEAFDFGAGISEAVAGPHRDGLGVPLRRPAAALRLHPAPPDMPAAGIALIADFWISIA